ncbi:helix-turn-helix domain-containing protein [Streptomyces sp. NPDC052225]|uniref:helix-turn-helix domain-containing protein n=1 Tax=Streptomyces sp. NPDC052225 TaxID=3154949 RepID=UPI003427854C
MQIHRIPTHEREFVIIDNKAMQDPRISHTARGILAYVLSMPNGAKINVRTLSDNFRQSRRTVSKAVEELRQFGYWVTTTHHTPTARRIHSTVDVYELPYLALQPAPVPTPTGTTPQTTGAAGTPLRESNPSKDRGKNPPHPPAEAVEPQGDSGDVDEPGGQQRHTAEATRILCRLASVAPRLRLTDRAVKRLAPAVADWLDRGAGVTDITDAVTAGLPAKVYSPEHLIADRLERKRPARKRQWRHIVDCPECRDPLPFGQETGLCADCALGGASLGNSSRRPTFSDVGPAAFRAARAALPPRQ